MTAVRRPFGITTRRAVCRILGSADSLPDRSKASKVLTTVACRLQLFVFEIERARYEQATNIFGIEQLLDRLHEHCQLLSVASSQGGGIQSGYALLAELSELLQELEASVLLLPGQLGSDARYKPALDELQALLANVSHYRTECEDTKRHLEAALSELIHGCTTRVVTPGAAASPNRVRDGVQATTAVLVPTTQSYPDHGDGTSGCPQSDGVAATAAPDADVAFDAVLADGAVTDDIDVLQRVRQAICALDLDVEMAERDQDLDAELLQLRHQIQQALQQQQQQQQPQTVELDELELQPWEVRQGALVRSGARRRRESAAATSGDTADTADAAESPKFSSSAALWSSSLSRSLSSTSAAAPLGAAPLGGDGGGESRSVSRLHTARRVSRHLAAQHLKRLKEQQRQLRFDSATTSDVIAERMTGRIAEQAGSDGDSDVQPAARRRRIQSETEPADRGPDAAPTAGGGGGAPGPAPMAFGRDLRGPGGEIVTATAVTEPARELNGRDGDAGGSLGRWSPVGGGNGSATAPVGSADQEIYVGSSSTTSAGGSSDPRVSPAAAAGASIDPWVGAAAAAGAPQQHELSSDCETRDSGVAAAVAAAVAASKVSGPVLPGPVAHLGLAAVRPSGGDAASGAEAVALAGPSPDGAPQRRPTEASVAALRKLNRVTQLAGMWEAGRPIAQQAVPPASDDGDAGGGDSDSGGLSDGGEELLGCGRSDDSGGGSDAGGELPARPAARRPVAAPPPLPALPDLPGHASRVMASSPFFMLAIQGRAPKAPPPPVLGRLLAPPPDPEALLEDTPASPAAPRGSGGGGGINSPLYSPTGAAAVAAGGAVAGGQRLRGAAAAPAPLPLPDASVHLRAVGLPGCFAQHWVPPGPFGLPAHAHVAAAGGLWLVGGVGAMPAAAGEDEPSGGNGGGGGGGGDQLMDFGPDVPTLDLHRDITGWGPCLGRGAFGAVYKALFRNKPAAVKVLHGGALDVRDMRSLRSEISLLCRLRHHPNIITVYGAAAAPPDHVALVTELMDCDLYDYIHRRRQNCVPLDEVLSIARAIASGLSELHPAIVHRDLKPANVLLRHATVGAGGAVQQQQQPQLDRRLMVKIADFGLARHKRSQYLSTRERDAGTLKYMAPECIASGDSGGANGNGNDGGEGNGGSGNGGGITEKCDIYSFGVLLYELITGREPWEGCHPLYAMCQVQSGVTLQLPDDPVRCPPELRALVLQCWCYQHHQRPTSRELLQQLDALIAARQQQLGAAAEEGGGGGALAEVQAPPPWQ